MSDQPISSLAMAVFRQSGRTPESIEELATQLAQPQHISSVSRYAASFLLMDAAHETRRAIQRRASSSESTTPGEDIDEITAPRSSYADWPLNQGTSLWDATREEIMEQVAIHHEQSAGHQRSAAFLAAVAKRIKSGQRVRDALKREQIQKIGQTIFGEEAE